MLFWGLVLVWLDSVCDLCDIVFPKVIKWVKFQKSTLSQWLVIRNLASSRGEGELSRQLWGDAPCATPVLETKMQKPLHHYVKAVTVDSRVSFIRVP